VGIGKTVTGGGDWCEKPCIVQQCGPLKRCRPRNRLVLCCTPQFTSALWCAVAEGLGVKLHRTTAYHPQANGLCERFHRSMKAALRASLKDGNWIDRLPWVMLGIRTAPKEDLQSSSAELVYGQPLRVPGDFFASTTVPWSASLQRSTLLDNTRLFTPVPTSRHGIPHSHVPPGLQLTDYVFIRSDAHSFCIYFLNFIKSLKLRYPERFAM